MEVLILTYLRMLEAESIHILRKLPRNFSDPSCSTRSGKILR